MKRAVWLGITIASTACGGAGTTFTSSTSGTGGAGGQGGSASSATTSTSVTASSSTVVTSSTSGGEPCGGGCPDGYSCGTANGIDVCRAASGIPLFSNVFVIMMENTSLATLQQAMTGGTAPNLAALASAHATGADYHGVTHPSLPNYIALTSGDTQGIGCDCKAAPGDGSCNAITCNIVFGSCSCNNDGVNLADQLEAAQKSWMAFGESMGAPCNLTDSGDYAVRHVPFLYYNDVQSDVARCNAHVVDYGSFDPASAAAFTFIAPNLTDDMHNPSLPSTGTATTVNIPNGDAWIGPQVGAILAAPAYTQGGLVVVLWDEDDDSGGAFGSDDPIGIYVMSPYARGGGYVSPTKADHYNLLATIEDGLGLPRLGNAIGATPLTDYFPDH